MLPYNGSHLVRDLYCISACSVYNWYVILGPISNVNIIWYSLKHESCRPIINWVIIQSHLGFVIFVAFLPDHFEKNMTFSNLIHWYMYVHDFVYYRVSVHRSVSLIKLLIMRLNGDRIMQNTICAFVCDISEIFLPTMSSLNILESVWVIPVRDAGDKHSFVLNRTDYYSMITN